MNNILFSSKIEMWETPQELFDNLNAEFHFTVDVCATVDNAKCEKFFTPEMDGLKQEWTGVCWCNPPYGRGIGKWMKKAAEAAAIVVCLVPVRTDTKWFHDWVLNRAEIRFIRGRLHFNGSKNSAPFPSMLVIYRPEILKAVI